MHLSTHNWMRAEPLETTLRRIKKFGYESIEISGEPAQYEIKETRALLKEHGIRCWGAVTLTLGERNLAAKDEGQRARSVDYVKSVITMVSELDGEIITLVPATVGKVVPDGTEEEEWKWVVDATRECFAHATEEGRAHRHRAAQPLRDLLLQPRRAGAGAGRCGAAPNAASASMPSTSTSRNEDMYDAIRLGRKAPVRLPRRRQQPLRRRPWPARLEEDRRHAEGDRL